MEIRLARNEDIPYITRLGKELLILHQTWDPDYYQLEENFDTLFSSWVGQQIDVSNQFIYIAENNLDLNKPVIGFISGFIKSLFGWFKIKSVGHISYLAIDSIYRHQGIGKQLEEAAKNWFKLKNISYVELYTDEKNTTGLSAWNAYGYGPFKKFVRKRV